MVQMPRILFTVPPFPVFIAAGEGVFKKGETHVKRVFSVFDLIYVKQGTLYITENETSFSVEGGEYILLSPVLNTTGRRAVMKQPPTIGFTSMNIDMNLRQREAATGLSFSRKKGASKSRPATDWPCREKARCSARSLWRSSLKS